MLDPQSLLILQLKVYTLLPTSPSFPPTPLSPGNHFSTVSMSLIFIYFPHTSDTL